jgi:hypothetical protein
MSITPQDLQKLLDEREASRASRKRAWENLQEIRWVLKDVTGVDLPPPARKTIDLEGRVVKDGVRTALRDRQDALSELVESIRKYRKLAEKTPLTLQGIRQSNPPSGRGVFLMHCRHDRNRRGERSEAAKPPRDQTAGGGIRNQRTAAERILSQA